MKIIITGLPYFGKKVLANLLEADKKNKYIFLNTYYSNADRLRFLWHIWSSDCVYSINGTTNNSFVISMAIYLNKRVVFHWVGSDVILAKEAAEKKTINERFLKYPVHLTDSPWFVEDLKKIGIESRYFPLLTVENIPEKPVIPDEFSILTYIPQNDQEFYGLPAIIEVAKQFPEIKFKIAGSKETSLPITPNIQLLDWVNYMKPLFESSTICIRFLKHDGLSFFVLESLLYGKHVIYNRTFNHCNFASNVSEMASVISELFTKFRIGELAPNESGREFVIREFSKENVLTLSKILAIKT